VFASPPITSNFSATYFEICHDSIKYSTTLIPLSRTQTPKKQRLEDYVTDITGRQAADITKATEPTADT
jgi:hypothetical protein